MFMKDGIRFILTSLVIYFSFLMFPNSVILVDGYRTALYVTLFLFIIKWLYSFFYVNVLINILKDKNFGKMTLYIVVGLSLLNFFINFICLLIVEQNYIGFQTNNILTTILLSIAIGIFTDGELAANVDK